MIYANGDYNFCPPLEKILLTLMISGLLVCKEILVRLSTHTLAVSIRSFKLKALV